MNVVATWLRMIGTPERATKLRPRLPRLHDDGQCPTTILFGSTGSRNLYSTDPDVRAALDAWDAQTITGDDLRRLCLWIEQGRYDGPVMGESATRTATR